MVKRGPLDIPVIGVAKAGWGLDELHARARESVKQHGGLDAAAFDKLSRLLRYVDGDYRDPATFQAIRHQLGPAQRPAHYLAIPPSWWRIDRKSTRLNSSHGYISYAVFCLKKKKITLKNLLMTRDLRETLQSA